MTSDDVIIKNEIMNDGYSIYIYYSEMYKEYVAYGYSAFIAIQNCIQEHECFKELYSPKFQMPMVMINNKQLSLIISKGIVRNKSYIDLYIESFIPFEGRKYDEWAQFLREARYRTNLTTPELFI